jgi:adenosylcobinamide kinase/adenosylcobinamide-phosphate guanylyltransferase
MTTVEVPLQLAQAIGQHSRADTLIVVDCLTLWLTNWLMPAEPLLPTAQAQQVQIALLLEAISNAAGPVVLVGNEIGLGVIALGREVRAFVDALGCLNQSVAKTCQRVTLMAAGLPLTLKDSA